MSEEDEKMEVVDKITLSKAIARRIGLTIVDAIQLIDVFEEEIIDSIKQNKKVQLNGFLIFTPRNVEGMTLTSPLDKKDYYIEPKRTVDVRVGKYFKDSIKSSYKGKETLDVVDKKSKGSKKKSKQD